MLKVSRVPGNASGWGVTITVARRWTLLLCWWKNGR